MAQTDERCDPWCYALQAYCLLGNNPATCKYAIYERTEDGVLKLKLDELSEAKELYEKKNLETKIKEKG